MNSDLVLSRELSQKLVEAGVWIDAEHYWGGKETGLLKLRHRDTVALENGRPINWEQFGIYPAPLTDELLRVMPKILPNAGWLGMSFYRGRAQVTYGKYTQRNEYLPNALGSLLLVPEVLEVVLKNMKEE